MRGGQGSELNEFTWDCNRVRVCLNSLGGGGGGGGGWGLGIDEGKYQRREESTLYHELDSWWSFPHPVDLRFYYFYPRVEVGSQNLEANPWS